MTYGIVLVFVSTILLLFAGSIILVTRRKSFCALLQLLGTACLMVVLLSNVAEVFSLVPWMDWDLPNSIGHYVDFWGVVLGLTLFPVGYLCHALRKTGVP
jgi:uncharacterized membrane protein (UPF0136 family)